MSDWTAGYIADIGYTYGYYTELNPIRVQLAFIHAGIQMPEVYTACELGFGQGVSVNIHSSASECTWYGTDFNPAQAGFAQQLADKGETGAALCDDDFASFASRADLPQFDYIGLHGIWSWISDANRRIVVEFIKQKLKVGGVLYISYNTQPGWAAFAPVRHLLTQHSSRLSGSGQGIVPQIEQGLAFVESLFATNTTFTKANPIVPDKFKRITTQPKSYLAHEYFNRDWHPMYFDQMHEALSAAKLSYACSAHILDHVDNINITAEQQRLLKTIPDPVYRETVRDFMVNQQFRRDFWVKGAIKLSPLEKAEKLRALRFILTQQPKAIKLKVSGSLGESNLSESVFNPVIEAMSDFKIRTFAQIEQTVSAKGVSTAQLLTAILILSGTGQLAGVQDAEVIKKRKKNTDKLNIELMRLASYSNDIGYLASPVTGGGIAISRFEQLFMKAYLAGKTQPSEWADYAWSVLRQQGNKLVLEGVVLETDEANLQELNKQAQTFHENSIVLLKALQVI